VVQHEGEDLLRIARPLSEALNGSAIDLVETLEGPDLAIKPPGNGLSLSDGF
jgi:iron-sulfur cluster assembly protein